MHVDSGSGEVEVDLSRSGQTRPPVEPLGGEVVADEDTHANAGLLVSLPRGSGEWDAAIKSLPLAVVEADGRSAILEVIHVDLRRSSWSLKKAPLRGAQAHNNDHNDDEDDQSVRGEGEGNLEGTTIAGDDQEKVSVAPTKMTRAKTTKGKKGQARMKEGSSHGSEDQHKVIPPVGGEKNKQNSAATHDDEDDEDDDEEEPDAVYELIVPNHICGLVHPGWRFAMTLQRRQGIWGVENLGSVFPCLGNDELTPIRSTTA